MQRLTPMLGRLVVRMEVVRPTVAQTLMSTKKDIRRFPHS